MGQTTNQEILERLKEIERVMATKQELKQTIEKIDSIEDIQREKMRELWDNKEDEIWEKV